MLGQQINSNNRNISQKPKIDIEKLVDISLPPSPGNVLRLSSLLRDVNASTHKITEIIIYEPMLVSLILRLANSPIYAVQRNITSIQTAVATVGNSVLLEMVMMSLASSTFAKEIRNSIIARKLWEHSLAVAIIARELAKILKIQATDEAFTCGLLHDIGKLVMLSYDFAGYSMVLSAGDVAQTLAAEREQFGSDHTEIGSLVARRWGLQEEVCYVIQYHHNPSQTAYPMLIAHIVEVADLIANIKGYGLRPESVEHLANSESLIRLRLTVEQIDAAWESVQQNIDEVIKTFL